VRSFCRIGNPKVFSVNNKMPAADIGEGLDKKTVIFSKKGSFVQNELKIVQNEQKKFKNLLRIPRKKMAFVQNEQKKVHFVITLACLNSSTLSYRMG
jgi:hypothetical protein